MAVGGYVYILASKKNGTLYTGVTAELVKRVNDHKSKTYSGFTAKHNVNVLVWYEAFPTIEQAIAQEKRIKTWKRAWKIRLIEENNPEWLDLGVNLVPE